MCIFGNSVIVFYEINLDVIVMGVLEFYMLIRVNKFLLLEVVVVLCLFDKL